MVVDTLLIPLTCFSDRMHLLLLVNILETFPSQTNISATLKSVSYFNFGRRMIFKGQLHGRAEIFKGLKMAFRTKILEKKLYHVNQRQKYYKLCFDNFSLRPLFIFDRNPNVRRASLLVTLPELRIIYQSCSLCSPPSAAVSADAL